MNGRTARLLRKFALTGTSNLAYRQLKRAYQEQPRTRRAWLKYHLRRTLV